MLEIICHADIEKNMSNEMSIYQIIVDNIITETHRPEKYDEKLLMMCSKKNTKDTS